MRKWSKLVITVFILVVLFLLVIPLYPNISTNIAGDANGGSSEIWVLNLHFGAYNIGGESPAVYGGDESACR